jgi:hypothetical protein
MNRRDEVGVRPGLFFLIEVLGSQMIYYKIFI